MRDVELPESKGQGKETQRKGPRYSGAVVSELEAIIICRLDVCTQYRSIPPA